MNIVVAFHDLKGVGMESNWVQLTGGGHNREYGGKHIVRSVSFDGYWCIQDPVGEDWGGRESPFKCLKG